MKKLRVSHKSNNGLKKIKRFRITKDGACIISLNKHLKDCERNVFRKYMWEWTWLGNTYDNFVKKNPKCKNILCLFLDDGFGCDYKFYDLDKLNKGKKNSDKILPKVRLLRKNK